MTQETAGSWTERDCPICGDSASSARSVAGIAPDPWHLVRCRACGFLYLQNPPDYQTLSSVFPWQQTYEATSRVRREAQGSSERALRKGLVSIRVLAQSLTHRDKLKRLLSTCPPGRVLDLGCDSGYNVEALSEDQIPLGVEISPELAAEARPRFEALGGSVYTGPVLEGLAELDDASCSGCIAKSYLEHEIQPRPVLEELHRVLQPGGLLVVKVPNYACWLRSWRGARWCGFRFPDHVNYFTPASLRELLAKCGFQITRFHLLDRFPTSDNMWCLAKKQAS